MTDLIATIDQAWEDRAELSFATTGAVRDAVDAALAMLDAQGYASEDCVTHFGAWWFDLERERRAGPTSTATDSAGHGERSGSPLLLRFASAENMPWLLIFG